MRFESVGNLFLALLRMVSPGKLLAGVSVGAITVIAISTQTTGAVAGYSLPAACYAVITAFWIYAKHPAI